MYAIEHVLCAFFKNKILYYLYIFLYFSIQNWNAYVGKFGERDFCFQESASGSKTKFPTLLDNHLANYCSPSIDNTSFCSQVGNHIQFGTVSIELDFTLQRHIVNSSKGIISTFSGKDIGAQIKGY